MIRSFLFCHKILYNFFYRNSINVYRVPLYYAVRRSDLNAVRLLLEYQSDPDETVGDLPMISIAANSGYSEVVLMLIEAGANLYPITNPPLLHVLNSGSKLCFSVLIEKREQDLLKPIDGELLVYHAAKTESSLLPLIAKLTKHEIEKLQEINCEDIPIFPPKRLNTQQKKELELSLSFDDSLLSTDKVYRMIKDVKRIW